MVVDMRELLTVIAKQGTATNGIWEASLERGDAGKLPSADHNVRRTVDIAAKLLATSEGQLPYIAGHKPVIDIEVRGSIIQVWIVVVLEALVACTRSANTGRCRLVVQTPGPCEDAGHCQIVSA